jgi:hypothetical protein
MDGNVVYYSYEKLVNAVLKKINEDLDETGRDDIDEVERKKMAKGEVDCDMMSLLDYMGPRSPKIIFTGK